MLSISLEKVSKSFNRQWIFKDLSLLWKQGRSYAITGPNGSGKSTLSSIMMGLSLPTHGNVMHHINGKPIEADQWYKHISFAAPYMEIIEEFTLLELLAFHFKFKSPVYGMSIYDIMETMYLSHAKRKQVAYFSSGMKQRLKLGLALFSDSRAVFLDEPTSNLDSRAKDWYLVQVEKVLKDRLVIVASNDPEEYAFCDEQIRINPEA